MRGVEACITERSPATGIFVEQAVEEGALMEKDKELVDGVQGGRLDPRRHHLH
ncbi:TPA: hypothetical protein ACH3X1_005340 [Trebouxia sp. C0004]